MSRAMLIGLTGAAGAGKDTVGALLQRAGWRSIAFADVLRVEVARAWVVHAGVFSARAEKELPQAQLAVEWCRERSFLHWCACQEISLHEPRSPRWVMQAWASWRRSHDPLYFVHHVEAWVNDLRPRQPPGLVITDVRMPNERDLLTWRGGYLVRVHRPGLAALPADTATHDSEGHTALQADADLHNDGDLQHLESETARVLQLLHDLQAVAAS